MLVPQSKMWLTQQLSHNRIECPITGLMRTRWPDERPSTPTWPGKRSMVQFTRPLRNRLTGGDRQFANPVAISGDGFGSDFAVDRVFDDFIIEIPGRTAQRAAAATLRACERYRGVSGAH